MQIVTICIIFEIAYILFASVEFIHKSPPGLTDLSQIYLNYTLKTILAQSIKGSPAREFLRQLQKHLTGQAQEFDGLIKLKDIELTLLYGRNLEEKTTGENKFISCLNSLTDTLWFEIRNDKLKYNDLINIISETRPIARNLLISSIIQNKKTLVIKFAKGKPGKASVVFPELSYLKNDFGKTPQMISGKGSGSEFFFFYREDTDTKVVVETERGPSLKEFPLCIETAHEFIHIYNNANGTSLLDTKHYKDFRNWMEYKTTTASQKENEIVYSNQINKILKEEYQTIFGDRFSENLIRKELGLPKRIGYEGYK
jgi:hypothetical protein